VSDPDRSGRSRPGEQLRHTLACWRLFWDHIRRIFRDHIHHASREHCRYIFSVSQEPKTGEREMLTSLPESFTSAYWRHRAEEARKIGDQMTNNDPRKSMLQVASQYERLAEFTEKMKRSRALLR
jgi:hypothetical protein